MGIRVCRKPGCPEIIDAAAYKGLCDVHRKEHDRSRGTRTERGYGPDHQTERARITKLINAGLTIHCARCHKPIRPGQPWALDHNDQRTGYLGPSHELCNDRAGGIASHQPRTSPG